MSSGKRGTTALALVAITLALLIGAVMLAATVSKPALEPTLKDVVAKSGESMRRGVRAIISKGLVGHSLNSWIIIHDLYGYGEVVDFILGVEWDGDVSYEYSNPIEVKPCVIMKTERMGLPSSFDRLNTTYGRIILHTRSGGVVEAEIGQPKVDEIYPCRIDSPKRGAYTVVIKVWLVDCKGKENACGHCDCYTSEYICEKPFCDPSDPPRGGKDYSAGVPHQPYGILVLEAQREITVKNEKYRFYGWLIQLTPPKEGSEWWYNPRLELFVDDHYHIKLVYRQAC